VGEPRLKAARPEWSVAGRANVAPVVYVPGVTSARGPSHLRPAGGSSRVRGALAWFVLLAGCLPDLRVFPPETTAGTCGDGFADVAGAAGPREACDPGEGSAPGCTAACALACEGGSSVATRHCYFVAGKVASFNAASELCRAASAHLVTFASDDEIRSAEAAAPSAAYWLGLTKDATNVYSPEGRDEPGFPEAPERGPCSGCFARTTDDGRFPDAAGVSGAVGCLVSEPGLREPWKRIPCNAAGRDYDVLCEREPPGALSDPCTGGLCLRLSAAGKRYLFVPSVASASDAPAVCRSNGGVLAKLEGSDEREALARELARIAPESGVWVGLARRVSDGPFQWEDGSAEGVKLWAEGEPDRDGRPKVPTRAFLDLRGSSYDRRLLRASPDDKARPSLCEY